MKERTTCRICSGELVSVLDLGELYPSNFVDESDGEKVPLHLVRCSECNLVQLKHTVDQDKMYRNYWYKSSLNPSMVTALKDVADGIRKRKEITTNTVLVDIGANDGTLLKEFAEIGSPFKVGYEPALNLPSGFQDYGLIINNYFNSKDFPQDLEQADIITAIAMFYDLEDPNTFLKDITTILADDGIFVVQFTDLVSMLKATAFDNICHEHLEYYSLEVLIDLFNKHGLEIFDIEFNKVNGGSIRVYAGWAGKRPIQQAVNIALIREISYLDGLPPETFEAEVSKVKALLVSFLEKCREDNKRIHVLGASTKGNTLLQYYNIDNTLIEYAAEINPDKFGKKTVGTNIPIISEQESLAMKPDYYLVLPWHFRKVFIEKFEDYIKSGGQLVYPLPVPTIVRWTDETDRA